MSLITVTVILKVEETLGEITSAWSLLDSKRILRTLFAFARRSWLWTSRRIQEPRRSTTKTGPFKGKPSETRPWKCYNSPRIATLTNSFCWLKWWTCVTVSRNKFSTQVYTRNYWCGMIWIFKLTSGAIRKWLNVLLRSMSFRRH